MNNTTDKLDDDLSRIRDHYDELARLHGDSPAAVQQSSRESQDERLRILAQIGPLGDASVLDLGCGTGRLLDILRAEFAFRGRYVGYDLSNELLKIARAKHPDGHFEQRDISTMGIEDRFDYAFVSGVFNNRVSDNATFIARTVEKLFAHVDKGLAFNAMSPYVDYQDPGLYYADPEALFRFCKEQLSPLVTLRHDYEVKPGVVPFDFTIYVYATSHRPRKKLIGPM